MSYKLEKPYTDKGRADFIVEYNHNKGLNIQETDTALYALEAWEKLEGDTVIDNSEEYQQEQAKKEAERIAMLNLTGADVERAIYKVKGIDFDDILAMVKDNPTIDEKALKIEFKANNFFRGNPYIEQVGSLLGFTSEMLDKFFETKDYTYLIPSEPVEDTSKDTSEQVEVQDENTTDTEQPTDVSNEVETKTTDEPNEE